MTNEEKFNLAHIAYQNAYANYSHFQVGAVVITKDERYFLGANVENASYGLSNCAERSALFSAYSNGVRKEDIAELVLIGKSNDFLYPCGACRQVIVELMNKDAKITLFRLDGTSKTHIVGDLMPYAFGESELHAK
jgi:cytidine deaminase